MAAGHSSFRCWSYDCAARHQCVQQADVRAPGLQSRRLRPDRPQGRGQRRQARQVLQRSRAPAARPGKAADRRQRRRRARSAPGPQDSIRVRSTPTPCWVRQPSAAARSRRPASTTAARPSWRPPVAACSTITASGCAARGRRHSRCPGSTVRLADTSYATPATALANAGSCAARAGQDRARGAQPARRASPSIRPTRSRWGRWPSWNSARAARSRPGHSPSVAWLRRRQTANALLLASQIEQKLGDTAAAARYVQRMRAEFPETQGSGMGDDGRR